MPALFQIDLGLSKEYKDYINDLLLFSTFMFVLHVFQTFSTKGKRFLNGDFVQQFMVTLIGISFYHLVIKKLFKIVYSDEVKEGYTSTIRLFK